MKRFIHILFFLVAAATLAGCASSLDEPEGGGGGDGGGGGSGTGGSCSGGVVQGYYGFTSNDSYYCGAGYTTVFQQEGELFIGGLEMSIDAGCNLIFADESCSGVYSNGDISLTCGECVYDIWPLYGYGCEEGVDAGLYDVNPDYADGSAVCTAGYRELSQSGYFIFLGDLAGYIDDKCAFGFSDAFGAACTGIYSNGVMAIDCGGCLLTATKMPLVSSFSLGPYTSGYSYSYGECSRSLLGNVLRLSITDVILDGSGKLALLTETSKLEAQDGGGNIVFSAALNADGTTQFTYGNQTVEAWFSSFTLPYYYKPSLKVSLSPSGCQYTYSPN